MYLYAAKRVGDHPAEWYADQQDVGDVFKTYEEGHASLPKAQEKVAPELREYLTMRGNPGFMWWSVFAEWGYWRKANQIHAWFVDKVQDGIDECQFSFVTHEQIQQLRQDCLDVLTRKKPKESLPTRGGFFFGSTQYDEEYECDLADTIAICTKVLARLDFKEFALFYHSSW